MAGATVVHFLADKLLSALEEKLKEEVTLVVTFKKEFESIHYELAHVKFMLKDAGEHMNSESMANWLKNLRDVLTDAMDLVEDCQEMSRVSIFQPRISEHALGRKIHSLWKRGRDQIKDLKKIINKIIFRLKKGREIKDLKKRINKINHIGNEYLTYLKSFNVNPSPQLDSRTPSSTLAKHVQIVGIHHEIDVITKKILQEGDPRIIAVWGMGGLGKTRLVKHVFNSKKVRNRFKHRIWLPVSDKFNIDQVLHSIAHQIKLPGDKLIIADPADGHQEMLTIQLPNDYHNKLTQVSTEGLRSRICRHLGEGEINDVEQEGPSLFARLLSYLGQSEKPSLFVLDDVWHKDVLEQIGLALQRQNNQNKIVVITRDKGVSRALGTHCYTHKKEVLSDEERLKLFCRHAFPDGELPPTLESLRPGILEKCTKLPKAVEAIAKSMEGVSVTYSHWEMGLRGLDKQDIIRKHVLPTLMSSYNALPHHLKACFLYFASYPPNTKIKSECLVYAWQANFKDFLPSGGNAVDVAWSYLNQLVDRCLIEASEFSVDGRVKFCQLQEFFHDLAVSESEKEAICLLKWGKELKDFPVQKCKNARRISLTKTHIPRIKKTIKCPDLRILSLRDNNRLASISASFFDKLKCLAVLDLSKTGIKSLPKSIGNLKRLKFLNLFRTKIEELPKSLSGLRSLLFLDVGECEDLRRLHSGIGEHASLQYLNVNGCTNLESLPAGISKLSCLQTLRLKGVVFNRKLGPKLADKTFQWYLTLMQHLSITFNSETSLSEGFISLQSWPSMEKSMRVLSLEYLSCGDECCTLPQGLGIMGSLERLRLQRLQVPAPTSTFWEYQLHNLKELTLEGDNSYGGSYYKGIEKIPNLRKLRLLSNENCTNFPKKFGESKAFPKLEELIIKGFKKLKEFPTLQDNTMPLLKYWQITNCSQMKDIPTGLEKLMKLRKMQLDGALLEQIQYPPILNAGKILMKHVAGWKGVRKFKNASGDQIEFCEETDANCQWMGSKFE